jgi:hypothetical protein
MKESEQLATYFITPFGTYCYLTIGSSSTTSMHLRSALSRTCLQGRPIRYPGGPDRISPEQMTPDQALEGPNYVEMEVATPVADAVVTDLDWRVPLLA